jgi:crotonobetaine/carnitine-CoA ligase
VTERGIRNPVTNLGTIADVLEFQATSNGGALFCRYERTPTTHQDITYREAVARSARVANVLQRLGVAYGSRFHVHLWNSPEFLDCWFAAARIGAVIVPTNPLSTADELAFILKHAECTLSITDDDLAEPVLAAHRTNASFAPVLVVQEESRHPNVLSLQHEPAGLEPSHSVAKRPAAGDIVSVLYTSGTTSRPKGVLVTNAAYLYAGEVVAQHLRLRPEDRHLIVLPLFHGNAQYYSTMSALVTGASIALMPQFSASRFGEQAARHRATVASLFAAPIRMILAHPQTEVDRHNQLRVCMFAQNVTDAEAATFERRFGAPLLQLYGMTETVAPVTMNRLYGPRRHSSIGLPVLGGAVRVVDDDGRDVGQGQVGELLVRGEPGATLMQGYLNDEEATSQAIREKWLHTGDNVRLDGDGLRSFVDRARDMIKRAGENVSPGEVERVLSEHEEVFEAAVIGVPDPMRDEAIVAYVVRRPGATVTAEELVGWCAGKLARFKVPEEVLFGDSLPRTSVGKVAKHALRENHRAPAASVSSRSNVPDPR